MRYDLLNNLRLTGPELGLFGLVILYVLAGYGIAVFSDALFFFNPVMYVRTGIDFTILFLALYVIGWCLWALYIMAFIRPPKLTAFLWNNLRTHALNKQRWMQALPVFIAFIFVLSTFTSLKTMIPYVNPFEWDRAFAGLDVFIHGGTDPWRLLHFFLGHPPVTLVINFVYNMWLGVLYLMLYWQLFTRKDPHTRMQFFYSMVFCFAIAGSFLAMYFSSAGPCFYEAVTGLDRFEPLMEYLNSVGGTSHKIWALVNQEYLWQQYTSTAHGIGAGISAMPSVHVATALIFMLVGWRSNKFWRFSSILFFFFILIGSVHLGWHYAVDGYAAILLTLPIWYFSGFLVRYFQKPGNNMPAAT